MNADHEKGIEQETKFHAMTDEEADYWDEYFTKNPPTLGPNGSGFLSQREARLLGMDNVSATWLRVRADATHQSIGQIINELVKEKIVSAAV